MPRLSLRRHGPYPPRPLEPLVVVPSTAEELELVYEALLARDVEASATRARRRRRPTAGRYAQRTQRLRDLARLRLRWLLRK